MRMRYAAIKKRHLYCLLLCAVGCATDLSPKLSNATFIDLFADAIELHRGYAHAPDTLMAKRGALFKRHGITRADIVQFLKDRQARPEKWDALIVLIQQRFGETAGGQMKVFQKTTKATSPQPVPMRKESKKSEGEK